MKIRILEKTCMCNLEFDSFLIFEDFSDEIGSVS